MNVGFDLFLFLMIYVFMEGLREFNLDLTYPITVENLIMNECRF